MQMVMEFPDNVLNLDGHHSNGVQLKQFIQVCCHVQQWTADYSLADMKICLISVIFPSPLCMYYVVSFKFLVIVTLNIFGR